MNKYMCFALHVKLLLAVELNNESRSDRAHCIFPAVCFIAYCILQCRLMQEHCIKNLLMVVCFVAKCCFFIESNMSYCILNSK